MGKLLLDAVRLQETGEVAGEQESEQTQRQHDANRKGAHDSRPVALSVVPGEEVHPLGEREYDEAEYDDQRQLDGNVHGGPHWGILERRSGLLGAPRLPDQEYSSSMRFGGFRFRFRLVPTLILALPVPLLFGLGVWQLDRAEQKEAQAERLAMREREAPLSVGAEVVGNAKAIEYRRVEVRGRLEPVDRIFLENRKYEGEVGFHVITPMRLEGSNVRVLVNQGWVAAGPGGSIPEMPGTPDGELDVRGIATVPSPPALVLHGDPKVAIAWGNRWPYLTVELVAAKSPYPLQPFVVLQSPEDSSGFVRSWSLPIPNPAMHIGYAIQWFAFAAIALFLYLKLSIVRDKENQETAA